MTPRFSHSHRLSTAAPGGGCGLGLAFALALPLLLPLPAQAIPAFARKYTTACGTCHAGVYPELNPYGRRFKERGYQLLAGAEEPAREATTVDPSGGQEPLLLLKEAPLAVRVHGSLVVPANPGAEGAGAVAAHSPDFVFPGAFYLMAGASVAPGVSLFASATVAPQAALHHGAIGFHDLLLGPGHLNLRMGRLLLLDFVRPEHRSLTVFGNPTATTVVGLNPTSLDAAQAGLDLFGRAWDRRLFWQVALVNGADAADGLHDLDGHKDLFAQLQWHFRDRVMLGVLGYDGRTQITSDTAGLTVRFTDRLRMAGAFMQASAGPLSAYAHGLWRRDQNPRGDDQIAGYTAGRAELDAFFGGRWLLIARYDRLDGNGKGGPARLHQATLHATLLLRTNLKLLVEAAAPLDTPDRSTLTLRLDVAL